MTRSRNPDEPARPQDQLISAQDYEVGHGRPPVASRFKPGHSGNPKGRPKGAKNLSVLIREKLAAKVPVREGGRQRLMSKAELGVIKLVNRFAETGNEKLFAALIKQSEGNSAGGDERASNAASSEDQSATHTAILKWFLEQNRVGEGDAS